MVVAVAAEPETGMPSVLVVSASELGSRSGGLLRALASGMVVRIDDLRLGLTVGYLSLEPPASAAGVLDRLPEQGTAADRVLPDLPGEVA
jgi:hypothetical protein